MLRKTVDQGRPGDLTDRIGPIVQKIKDVGFFAFVNPMTVALVGRSLNPEVRQPSDVSWGLGARVPGTPKASNP